MKQCRKDENYRRQDNGMPPNLLQTLLLEFQAHLEAKPVNHTAQLDDLASYVLTPSLTSLGLHT
jgi:hypothetical protein